MLRFQKTSRQELWSETNSDRESEDSADPARNAGSNSPPRKRWENADHDDWVAVDAEHRPDRTNPSRRQGWQAQALTNAATII
jgi:hypothetical protein